LSAATTARDLWQQDDYASWQRIGSEKKKPDTLHTIGPTNNAFELTHPRGGGAVYGREKKIRHVNGLCAGGGSAMSVLLPDSLASQNGRLAV